MPTTEKLRNKLMAKLTELFQLDQPDLDFGFYRIMQAKAQQVKSFIDKDLLQIIEDAFGQVDEGRKAELAAAVEKAIQTAKDFGAPNPEETEPVKKAKAALDALRDGATAESDVYDHLYRFFERYYDEGDFISRRYYARENAGKAAPFAIPYNGEEVKLHWANADQYYIKTAEYFSNYSFDITQAAEIRKMSDGEKVLNGIPEKTLKVHFRIVDASEGEHGNVKAAEDKKRFFILHEETPVEFNDADELVINFEYKALPGGKNDVDADTEKALKEKFGKSLNKGDMPNLAIAEKVIEAASGSEKAKEYLSALGLHAPTDKISNRPLLAKYINQYTARNTCDYFIHKDLSGFLKRELDFYIKNEVMHLDDIENADAPAVENYLAKLKVIRKIATKLIDFLAQLEDFQKKLWLKKKFVTETNYCITLDRISVDLYEEIAANDAQCEEWVKLFAIDEIKGDAGGLPGMGAPEYSVPLTTDFLKANDKLVLDTAFFSSDFKAKLIASIEDFDEQCDGLLIHSENFQALNLLRLKEFEKVNSIYIDPPYNTGQDEFLYKDNYQSSSWISLIADRIKLSHQLINDDGAIAISIDENEISNTLRILDDTYGKENRAGIATVKRGSVTGHKAINKGLVNIVEYIVLYAKNKSKWEPQRAFKARGRNDRYNNFIENRNLDSSEWRIISLLDAFSQHKNIPKRELKQRLGKKFEDEIYQFVKDNAASVIQLAYPDESNVSKDAQEAIKKSRKNKSEILHFKRNGVPDMYLIGGQRLLFYSDRLVEINGETVTAEPLSDIWDDILPNDLHNEGGVSLKKGKKPENLLNRIYDICCKPQDCVLDFFLGSGTTAATALKRNIKFIGIEQSNYFDDKALLRLKLVNKTNKKHEAERDFCFKYIRLESYEDTLNNLVFDDNPVRGKAIESNPSLKEDYMLRYLLDVETRGSQSLLNIDAFADPCAYALVVKKPGSDEQVKQHIDLIETFNYLLGLRLENMAAPQTFTASFTRKPDPELPEDQHTKLVVDGKIQQTAEGKWWFRKLEGWVPADPMNPNNGQKERVLIVWRKLTGNLEEDNLMLDEWFEKFRISTRDFEYDTIYVNGSNNLPNLKKDDENWKVRLIEEEFHKKMWEVGGEA
ncbi:DNA methyltransferase [Desulfatibacillum aliphaticivorans]|uniref:DNA methyltransferase n=1 Tax=Desulfatibacillum aliphaticivorans TaxID=218208 RepID=UPI000414E7FF|nr:site-specific DNA-methyltransferase [Desulfatibacillum aliphaticivorans]